MLEEENGYFRAVVKDAISDLTSSGVATVFLEEQANYIKKEIPTVKVKYDGTFYKLSITEEERKEIKRGRKKKNKRLSNKEDRSEQI